LGNPEEDVIVLGKNVGQLPDAEYRVIKALVDAHAKGKRLPLETLRNRTKDDHGNKVEDPRGALRRLRKKDDTSWGKVICMSGKQRRGYGLTAEPNKPPTKPNKPPTKTR
jgi:hypothetical protein